MKQCGWAFLAFAVLLAVGWGVATLAVVLATLNARNGDWGSWAIDGAMFVVQTAVLT